MTTVSADAEPVPAPAFAEGVPADTLARADEVLDGLVSSEGRDNPYPWYRQLRELAPFYRSGWDGLWYASRYDDCKAVLVDPRCGRNPQDMLRRRHGMNMGVAERLRRRMRRTMLTENPPEHTR
ncbi:MAG: cytochrome P450, partial [Acidimicrobiia bacterium]